jgi:hypothetical protein
MCSCLPSGATDQTSTWWVWTSVEDRADVGQRVALVEVEDDHRPLVGVEPAEAPFELIAIGEADPRVGIAAGQVERRDLDDRRAMASQLVAAGVHEQAAGPGVELPGIPEARQEPPRVQWDRHPGSE